MLYNVSKIGALVLGCVGILLWILLVGYTNTENIDNAPMQWMFYISYALIGLSILATLVSGAKNILSSPKALKKTIIYTGAFIVIVGLAYVLAGDQSGQKHIVNDKEVSEFTKRVVSTGLITFYILTAVAVGSLIVSSVRSALTK